MKFELTDEQYKRLWGDKQDAIDLLEYSSKMLDDALQQLAKDTDMITEEEIKEHLAHTVYSSGARKSIIGYLTGAGYDTNDIEFAKRNCSAREESAKTFEDFVIFVREKELENRAKEMSDLPNPKFVLSSVFRGMCEETAKELAEKVRAFYCSVNGQDVGENDDFQIGDVIKYMSTPDESATEYVEAIANDGDGGTYLCLSNGEYVRPCYCVKYKVQGEERRKLIDKLNEVV